ncbi:hypothetical protein PV721_35995 [Streptomyces sp. MB09-01]|uniref:tetratricopeptide repeat protein n=1 Tax=Streptomyces sp. MB09-01 TaxID=3028666 RepID=UPI0029BF11BA|nr:hypothetical protein [Streptomyces sp. MB09-01]MDX3539638.1 hypothetical protein [Streptomyces sp. MB09-01]
MLRRRVVTSVNGRDALADLLARHDRIEELRAYAATETLGHAARSLAEVLEEHGDVEGAISVYRTFAEESDGMWHVAHVLSQLLVRHGLVDDAIAVMHALADSPYGADDCVVDTLCTLHAEHGRAHDGLAYLDALKERRGGFPSWSTAACATRRSSRPGRIPKAAPGRGLVPLGPACRGRPPRGSRRCPRTAPR